MKLGLDWRFLATKMSDRVLLRIGIIGSLLAALCCFTPLLVMVLSSLGFGTLIGVLDYILFPALIGFLALTLYAWLRMRRS